MIYRTNKSKSKKQDGVTLLLAVLVLAAVTAISFSLATIVFVEIRASGDVLRTEPALYAAQAVTEEAFFQYKRSVPTNVMDITQCSSSALAPCTLPSLGVNLTNPKPALRSYNSSPLLVTLPPGASKTFLLVDPEAPNNYQQAFTQIGAQYVKNGYNGTLTVLLDKYNQNGDRQLPAPIDTTLAVSESVSYAIPNGDIGQYQLALSNPGTDGSIIVSVSATDVNGNNRIPLIGRQVLDITASYLGLTRKYTAEVPLQ